MWPRIAGIERIRFTTSHPLEFSDSLIEAYANLPQLANHLHLPVQSGSDRILALMKRGYTTLEYKQRMRALRAVRPDIAVSSDIIVGFPGETERDFEATLRLVADAISISPSVFSTAAVPAPRRHRCRMRCRSTVKQERLRSCRRCSMRRRSTISRGMVGSVQRVLVERARQERSRPIWPAAPRTIAGSIFPAPHRCCSGSWM